MYSWLLLVLMLAGAASTQARPLKIAFQNSENAPYQMDGGSDINWHKPGIAVELVKLAAARINLDVQFQRLPWKRGLEALKDGSIDGLFSASHSQERLQFGVYPRKNGQLDATRRSYVNAYSLYKLKGTSVEWDGQQFSGLNGGAIGTSRGFSIVADLKKMGVRVEETNSMNQDLEKLLRARLAGVAALELAADHALEGNATYRDKIIKLQPPLATKDYYLMLSHQFVRDEPKLAEALWNAVAEVRDSKQFKQATGKYFD